MCCVLGIVGWFEGWVLLCKDDALLASGYASGIIAGDREFPGDLFGLISGMEML